MNERVAVLETKLDGLSAKLDKVLEHQEGSAAERSEIKALLSDMDKRLKIVEPIAADVSRWRERAIGARMAVVGLWIMLGGALASIASWAMKAAGFWPR